MVIGQYRGKRGEKGKAADWIQKKSRLEYHVSLRWLAEMAISTGEEKRFRSPHMPRKNDKAYWEKPTIFTIKVTEKGRMR